MQPVMNISSKVRHFLYSELFQWIHLITEVHEFWLHFNELYPCDMTRVPLVTIK